MKHVSCHVIGSILTILSILGAHPADPSSLLSKYAIYGEDSLVLDGEGITPERGWVGTKGVFRQNGNYDPVTYNSIIKVGSLFEIGNEKKTYKDTVYVRGSVTGNKSLLPTGLLKNPATFADPVLPKLTGDQIKVGTERVVATGKTQTLAPGSYKSVTVASDGDVLTLGPGIYEMDSLIVRGRIHVAHPTGGITRILVRTQASFVNAGGTLNDLTCDVNALGKVLVYCAGTQNGAIDLDDHEEITAAVVAPFSNLYFQTHAVVKGQILAKSVKLSVDFTGYQSAFVSFQPGNVEFPEDVLNGIPEDSSSLPRKNNSYLLSFPLKLVSPADTFGTLKYEVLSTATRSKPATELLDFNRTAKGATSSGTITFLKGDSVSQENISIWIEDDYLFEPDSEFITVRLANPDSVVFENDSTVIEYHIPILSEDPTGTKPDMAEVIFPQTLLTDGTPEDRSGNPQAANSYLLSFPLDLKEKSPWNGTVQYEILGVAKKTPSAVEFADFIRDEKGALASGTIRFAKESTRSSDSIKIWIVDDSKIESDEYLTVRLFNPESVFVAGEYFSFRIVDEDTDESDTTDTTGTIDPKSTIAGALFDQSGDGRGDSISMTLTSDRKTTADIAAIIWNWSGSAVDTLTGNEFTTESSTKVQWSVNSLVGVGKGTVKVIYLDSLTTSGTISDSVGSAIVTATADLRDKNRTSDRLELTLSEQTAVPTGSWLIFFKDSSESTGDSAAVITATTGSGTTAITAQLTKGYLQQGDWVQLHAAKAILDGVSNRPGVNNQKVRISIAMDKNPVFSKGALFDRYPVESCDGYGDSGAISITLGVDSAALTMNNLEKLTIGGKTVPFTVKSPTELWFRDTTLTGLTGSVAVQLSFTGGVTVSGSLDDSVGPVLVNGTADLRNDLRAADTVLLSASEMVTISLDTVFHFYSDSLSPFATTIKPLAIVASSTQNIVAVFPKGTVTQGLWVNFVPNSSVLDRVGNRPRISNQKVPLMVEMNRMPRFQSGVIYDRLGKAGRRDGYGDSGIVRISLAKDSAAITAKDLLQVSVVTPTGTVSVPFVVVSDSVMTFFDSTIAGVTGAAKVNLLFNGASLTGTLADSIAPAAVNAVLEKWPTGDSLQVTFTESLSKTGTAVPFHFENGIVLTLHSGLNQTGVVRYAVQNGSISAGDSLWISASGEIADTGGVVQDREENTHVPVLLLEVITPKNAWFTDESDRPDGIADHITVVTAKPVPASLMNSIASKLTIPATRGTVSATGYEHRGDTLRFQIDTTNAAVNTAVGSAERLNLTDRVRTVDTLLYFPAPLAIEDRMAPVQLSASYRFGSESTDADSLEDTLIVTYSEPIAAITSETPYELSGANGSYTIALRPNAIGGDSVASVRIFRLNDPLPVKGDSLWISGTGKIVDRLGNEQIRDTRPVEVTIPLYQTSFSFTIYPNPARLEPNGTFVNEYLKAIGEEASRVAVIVTPLGLRPLSGTGNLSASIAIRDVVGNKILDEENIIPLAGLNRDQVFVFGLKNKQGRRLSSGSYLLVTKITGPTTIERRMTLGIAETAINGKIIRE